MHVFTPKVYCTETTKKTNKTRLSQEIHMGLFDFAADIGKKLFKKQDLGKDKEEDKTKFKAQRSTRKRQRRSRNPGQLILKIYEMEINMINLTSYIL